MTDATPEKDRSPVGAARAVDPAARLAAARATVARETRRSRFALAAERAVAALWPLWAVAAAFLGLAFLGLPQQLPFWGHVALLAVFAAGAAAALWRAVGLWRAPSLAEARARLDAGAPDRPVAALDDALAAGASDPSARSVWAVHQARMAERAARLRAAAADLRVSGQDRYALRHLALLALAAGVLAQVGDRGARLVEALTPAPAAAALAAVPTPSLEAWASPPVHTGVAPLYLTERIGETAPIALPVGSEIVLRVFDSPQAPALTGPAAAGAAFADETGGTWTATVALTAPGELAVAAGGDPLAAWRFEVIADAPPAIAFTAPPTGARSGALQFAFETSDDYGVVSARATVTLDVSAAPPLKGLAANTVAPPIEFELPLPLTGDAEAAAEEVVEDLIAHPYAGLPVIVALIATDGAGQEGRAEARIAMPGRRFFEPLAKAIIEQRRHLAWSVDAAPRALDVLNAVTAWPEDVFDDPTAYLATRTAVRRLSYAVGENRVAEEAESILELLWLAALRIEDGDLSDAERRLRELQEELSDALERGASDDEISQLMQELREALQEYLRQLAQEMMRDQMQGRQQPQQPVDPNQLMSEQDLMDMLDQLEEAMRNGSQELARQMLEQLQQMLENLQMAQPGQQPGQQGQGEGAMGELQDMIGQQQGLADRSFDALRQGQQSGQGQPGGAPQGNQQGQTPGQGGQGRGDQQGQGQAQGGQPQPGQGGAPGGPDLGAIARDQEALRRMLEDLRQGLPGEGAGQALDRADRSMGQARESLEQGDADGALQNQVEALDALREGAQALAREMQQQGGQAQQAGREGPSGEAREEDPFGRPTATDGPLDGESVRVPDAAAMKRARELMDEIRRRAGDRTRALEELDYLRRLLDRF